MTGIFKSIKSLFDGCKPYEFWVLGLVLVFIIVNAIIIHDHVIAVISAIFGILYTAFAGKGKVACFFFGLLGSGCYAYISFKHAVWGNLFLYLCYYIPLQIIGIFQWKNNLKEKSNEIVKIRLSFKERVILTVLTIFLALITIYLINYFNGSSPVIDGITTIFSIVGMYLTVRRCIEQWYLWIVVNGLCTLMWANLVFFNGVQAFSTVVMWAFYFVMAIYFLHEWKKEVKF